MNPIRDHRKLDNFPDGRTEWFCVNLLEEIDGIDFFEYALQHPDGKWEVWMYEKDFRNGHPSDHTFRVVNSIYTEVTNGDSL